MAMSAALDATRRLSWGPGEEDRQVRRIRRPRRMPRAISGLFRRLIGTEPIEMLERRHGYFPQAFVWRSRRYEIWAVQRCWTATRHGLRGKVERHYFRVRARVAGDRAEHCRTFAIYQDLQDSTWHLERSRA